LVYPFDAMYGDGVREGNGETVAVRGGGAINGLLLYGTLEVTVGIGV
jgi:hypothetical protein